MFGKRFLSYICIGVGGGVSSRGGFLICRRLEISERFMGLV